MLWFLFACLGSKNNGSLELTEPASLVFGLSNENRLMVVISDLPSLCAELQSGEPPQGDWWSLSLWTQNRAVEEGTYPAFGHLNISESKDFTLDSGLDYWRTASPEEASLEITKFDEGELKGEYSASFQGDISTILQGDIEAVPCDGVYLFAGISE